VAFGLAPNGSALAISSTLAPVRAVFVVSIEIRNRMCIVKRHPMATGQRPLTAQTEPFGKGMASKGGL
jgi:hypothetical protein